MPNNTVIGLSGVTALRGSGAVSFVRPLNTTAYTAGDVISADATATAALQFPVARAPGGGGYLVKATLDTDSKTFLSQCRLYLFNAPPASIVGDNVAQTILFKNVPIARGYIDFPTLATGAGSGSTCSTAMWTGNVEFRCAPGDDALYGYLVDATGSTPTSGQRFTVKLEADVY